MNEKKIFQQVVRFINLNPFIAFIYIITQTARDQQYERNISFCVFLFFTPMFIHPEKFYFMQVYLLLDTTLHTSFQSCHHFKCASYISSTTTMLYAWPRGSGLKCNNSVPIYHRRKICVILYTSFIQEGISAPRSTLNSFKPCI